MPKLIALDDGHGMETAGKRTPTLPDGSVMRENEFNRRVVQLLAVNLQRCGFDVILVAPTDADTPLRVRTDTANRANADLYVSVHANAYGPGGFNKARGIETLYKPSRPENKVLAQILHRNMLASTRLPDRGLIVRNDLLVLNTAVMPAALVECGFMTHLEEAHLLRTEAYRAECAEELTRGICEYFSVQFVKEVVAAPVSDTIHVVVNGHEIHDKQVINNTVYVQLRDVGEALGATVTWDGKTKTAALNYYTVV